MSTNNPWEYVEPIVITRQAQWDDDKVKKIITKRNSKGKLTVTVIYVNKPTP